MEEPEPGSETAPRELPQSSKPKIVLAEGCLRSVAGAIIGAIIGASVTILVLKVNGPSDPANQNMAWLFGPLYGAPIGATVGFLIAAMIR